MAAVPAADAREALLQIAALQESPHGMVDDRTPEAILTLITLVVHLLKRVKMLDRLVKRRLAAPVAPRWAGWE